MTKKGEPDAEEQQDHLTSLVNRCIDFVDCNGQVLIKEVNSIVSVLVMGYKEQDIAIRFLLTGSATPDGACAVEVRYKEEIVFEAKGRHMGAVAYHVIAITYIPGEWEKKIPENSSN